MFNLIGIGEHAGSGVPEIFETWKNEGLEDPKIEESFGTEIGDRTKVTLPLVSTGAFIEHSAVKINIDPSRLNEILEFCNEPKTRTEIQKFCGYKSPSHFRERIIAPLLAGGQLILTIPDKPNSPKQKYVRRTSSQA